MAQSVKFEEIKTSCSNLQGLASNMKITNGNIDGVVSKVSDPNWAGDAANNYRDKLQILSNKLPDAQHQLALSVLFLASCSDGYEILGNNNVNTLIDLAGGQAFLDSIDYNSLPNVDLNSRVEQTVEETTNNITPTSDNRETSSSGGNNYTGSSGGGYYVNPSYSTGAGAVSSHVTSGITPTPSTVEPGTEVKVPSDIKQGGYTVTGYDYWIESGKEMVWTAGTNQRLVSDIWKQQGSKFKNGIAVINVDGEDRYLVAVTPKFGSPGDKIDVKLADGSIIKCIIGDSKGDDAGSEWGHVLADGSINILEFEVERATYLEKGNPTTESWGLDWDSSQGVSSIKNLGSILEEDTSNSTNGETTGEKTNLDIDEPTEARDEIISVAESQLDNTDSSEYLDMIEETEGTKWCSEFVTWCAKKSGYVDSGIIPKLTSASSGAEWFKEHNQFQDQDYTPKPGDILFTGEDNPTNTALVTDVKDNKVIAIEGDGKSVKKVSRNLDDSQIYGYGTPDYNKLVKEDNNSSPIEV